MKKSLLTISLVCVLTICLGSLPAFAQGVPKAKSAVQVGNAVVTANCKAEDPEPQWNNVYTATMKTPAQKDLIMGVSLETLLTTYTAVGSLKGKLSKATAEAYLKVRVLVDGDEAYPGPVMFDRRLQELTAVFNGVCTDANGDGIVQYTECDDPESVSLLLDTTQAHHFNFALDDVGVGVHDITVQACYGILVDLVPCDDPSCFASGEAGALLGNGSLTVEEVRLVKDADIVVE